MGRKNVALACRDEAVQLGWLAILRDLSINALGIGYFLHTSTEVAHHNVQEHP